MFDSVDTTVDTTSSRERIKRALSHGKKGRINKDLSNKIMLGVFRAAAYITTLVLVAIIAYVVINGLPHISLDFIFGWPQGVNLYPFADTVRSGANEADTIEKIDIGGPSAITNLTQSVGIVMINLFLLPYGTDAVAAMGIALKVIMIAVLVFVGFAFGAQPLIGYNYGARNMPRLRGILRFSYLFLSLFALVMTVVLSLSDRLLMGFFIEDAHHHAWRRQEERQRGFRQADGVDEGRRQGDVQDRKSTRLNSSH